MACTDDVLFIQNPLWNGNAELGEADYASESDRTVGFFDIIQRGASKATLLF